MSGFSVFFGVCSALAGNSDIVCGNLSLFSKPERLHESLELASARLRRESLECGRFRKTGAPRSVSLATRVAKHCGKLASFAACCWNLLLPRFAFGTFFLQGCAAKVLGTKNLAKHGRYAAFRSQRGRPKIVASWLHSRFAFGTCFRQLGPRKFCVPKF